MASHGEKRHIICEIIKSNQVDIQVIIMIIMTDSVNKHKKYFKSIQRLYCFISSQGLPSTEKYV